MHHLLNRHACRKLMTLIIVVFFVNFLDSWSLLTINYLLGKWWLVQNSMVSYRDMMIFYYVLESLDVVVVLVVWCHLLWCCSLILLFYRIQGLLCPNFIKKILKDKYIIDKVSTIHEISINYFWIQFCVNLCINLLDQTLSSIIRLIRARVHVEILHALNLYSSWWWIIECDLKYWCTSWHAIESGNNRLR